MDEKRKSPIWTKDFIGITLINLFIFCGFQMLLRHPADSRQSAGRRGFRHRLGHRLATISCLLIRPFSGVALDKYGAKAVLLAGSSLLRSSPWIYVFPHGRHHSCRTFSEWPGMGRGHHRQQHRGGR
jgi:hypothetical protein